MKRTLQLSEIAPYLPYGLRYSFDNHKYYGLENLANKTSPQYDLGTLVRIGKEELIYPISVEWDDPKNGLTSSFKFKNDNFKPIPRPLSECLKDDGFTDLHSDYSLEQFIIAMFTDLGRIGNWKTFINLEQAEYLFTNHFDVFSLIPDGLAIDINTLEGVNNE